MLETRRREAQKRLEKTEAAVFRSTSAIAAAESSLTALAGRRQSAADEIKQRQSQLAQHQQSAASVEQALAGLRSALATHDTELTTQAAQRPALQAAIAARTQGLRGSADQRSMPPTTSAARSSYAWRRCRACTRAWPATIPACAPCSTPARGGTLKGVVGTVASLVRVPSQYEAAIGAALGSHEQDIVTETWQDAEAAVELLRQSRGGRSTFLPLDVIRGRGNNEQVKAPSAGQLTWWRYRSATAISPPICWAACCSSMI